MYNCEKCGKLVYKKFGSGRFCSISCANSREHTEQQKINIGKGVKAYYTNNRKKRYCSFCGTEIKSISKTKFCCNDCKVKSNQVKTLIKYFGFNEDLLGTNDVFNEWVRIRNTLNNLYHCEDMSSTEICKLYNYPSPSNLTAKVFKYLNIKSKSNEEATRSNYLNNRLNPGCNYKFKSGWHKTWNDKDVFLRSSYEIDYADKLDSLKENYDVESFRIEYFDSQKNKVRIAIPDFYLIDSNKIVEVKSGFTLNIRNMIDKATEYIKKGYNFELILEHKSYSYEDLIKMGT